MTCSPSWKARNGRATRSSTNRPSHFRISRTSSISWRRLHHSNSIGGDLLIGVAAKSGIPVGLPGWENIDLDQEKLRIENLLRDQIEPRLSFKLREIPLRDGNAVVMLRVPWSSAQPHM